MKPVKIGRSSYGKFFEVNGTQGNQTMQPTDVRAVNDFQKTNLKGTNSKKSRSVWTKVIIGINVLFVIAIIIGLLIKL